MRFQSFVCLLLAGLACGQTTPAPSPGTPAPKAEKTAPEAPPAKTVAPDDPVLTVKGVCVDPGKQGNDCKTVVTRAQFEKLSEARQPNMPAAFRRNLASQYAVILQMSSAAEKRGLDKQPRFDELMHLMRMQILAGELNRALKEEADKVSDADFEDYYKKNAANFEQADLLRLMVPRTKQIANPKPGTKDEEIQAQQKAGEAEMQKLADALHARAAKGEDFEKLQKEAYAAAGLKGNPPDTKLSKTRRTVLPHKQAAVFDLKAGALSETIPDPSGYFIYKMVTKQTMPLDSVKDEIRNTLSGQRYRDVMQSFQNPDNAELNDAYFGPGPKAPGQTPPRGGKPAAQEEEDRH